LLLVPGGGLNSTISFFAAAAPFDPIAVFKGEYRCVTMDLRNAIGGQSSGPLEIEPPGMVMLTIKSACGSPEDRQVSGHGLLHRRPFDLESSAKRPGRISLYPWKDPKDRIPLAVRHIRSFLQTHRSMSGAD
jgi:hypothetical protein